MKHLFLEVAILGAIILLLSAGTLSRNNVWNDEIGFSIDCVKKSPKKARPYVNLGVAYYNAGVYDKSLEITQKALQIDPKFGQAYYNLGLVYQKTGDLNKAIAGEKKALEVDPSLGMPYYTLGQLYLQSGQYEESETAFQTFLSTHTDFPDVHNFLAVVYMSQKKFDKAIIELEKEIKISSSNSLAHLNLGQIYWYEFQNKQKALDHLRTALMLNPVLPNRGEIRKLVRLLEGLP